MSSDQYIISNDDLYLLAKGDWHRSWEKMGAHKDVVDGVEGFRFAVWVPGARKVSVIGGFNDWNIDANLLTQTEHGGVWCGFVPGAAEGDLYKYYILCDDGSEQYKADPYAFYSECPPGTASRLTDLSTYTWHDGLWMGRRANANFMKRPLNIYEVHLGSWKRHDDGLDGLGFGEGGGSYLTYEELSNELVDYVAKMGYTHIELMPVMEHPFDGSWGYQTTGYYAPTARYGDPKQFMAFMDKCHQAGIGVILDWVPGHFCRDIQGLVHFNGHRLYEKEEHPNWGTYKFDFSRGEVRTFLLSNALFWLEMYHADGIRMDGVTSMLYLNFGVDDPAQKKFNKYGDEGDLEAIDFIRQINDTVDLYHKDVMMIAEESTAWPLVTASTDTHGEKGMQGLGFDFKWDMGWMNDTLNYCKTDFPWRPGNHRYLTFSMMYAFAEHYILPLSHDEVVHGKASLVQRQPGDWWRQFAGLRCLALYQMTHTGGKLNFMGNEIAQFIEWRYYEGIQWFLTDQYETHRQYQHFTEKLNAFFKENKGLWQKNYEPDGFQWIDADNAEQSIISYVRKGDRPVDDRVVLINWDPANYEEFVLGVPREGDYIEVFNSDAVEFGGSGVVNEGRLPSHPAPTVVPEGAVADEDGKEPEPVVQLVHGQENYITLRVPPLAGIVLKRAGKSSYVPPKPPRKRPARKAPAKKAAPKAAEKAAEKPAVTAKAETAPATDKAAAPKAAPAKKAPAKAAAAKVAQKTTAAAKKTTAAAKTAAAKVAEKTAEVVKPAAKKAAAAAKPAEAKAPAAKAPAKKAAAKPAAPAKAAEPAPAAETAKPAAKAAAKPAAKAAAKKTPARAARKGSK